MQQALIVDRAGAHDLIVNDDRPRVGLGGKGGPSQAEIAAAQQQMAAGGGMPGGMSLSKGFPGMPGGGMGLPGGLSGLGKKK